MIKFVDLLKQQEALESNISEVIDKVLTKSQFILGPEVKTLEDQLSAYTGTKCITVANGTDALYVALLAHEIKENDEVLIPSFTWVSTAETICQLKAKPVFVDIDNNFNIDLEKIKEKITEKTKAIMPVSMFGRCSDLNKIQNLAKEYNLKTIEDAAQSFGAKSSNDMSCSIMDISTTSFFPAKPLGCYGDGGAIFTKDEKLYEKIKTIPRHGQMKRYEYVEIGINSRLDTIQAAVLLEKLKIFETEILLRNKVARRYDERLKENDNITTPNIPSNVNRSVWAQYTILLNREISHKRDTIMQNLKERGVPTALYYPVPLHTAAVYKNYDSVGLDRTIDFANRVLSLPMHPYLTEEETNLVCDSLIQVIEELI